jgi:hypothetical protein
MEGAGFDSHSSVIPLDADLKKFRRCSFHEREEVSRRTDPATLPEQEICATQRYNAGSGINPILEGKGTEISHRESLPII